MLNERITLRYDILIINGRVIDRTGNPWIRADISIVNRKIARIGCLDMILATITLDARGLVICLGFINLNKNSDFVLLSDLRFLEHIFFLFYLSNFL